jgi:hypothetical protein
LKTPPVTSSTAVMEILTVINLPYNITYVIEFITLLASRSPVQYAAA